MEYSGLVCLSNEQEISLAYIEMTNWNVSEQICQTQQRGKTPPSPQALH